MRTRSWPYIYATLPQFLYQNALFALSFLGNFGFEEKNSARNCENQDLRLCPVPAVGVSSQPTVSVAL